MAERAQASFPQRDRYPAEFPPVGLPNGVTLEDIGSGSETFNGKAPKDPRGFSRADPYGMYRNAETVSPATHPLEPLYLPDFEREVMGLSPAPEYTTDTPRAARVVFIGGGMAGINFGIMAQYRLKNASFRIFEKNPEMGGTWYDNKYPGLRCDVPSYSYTFRFENNDWSESFAQGPEIKTYFQRVAKKYNILPYVTFNAEVRVLEWQEDRKKWKIGVEVKGKMEWDEADFVISGMGFLNRPKNPDIPGFSTFPRVVHTARWPSDLVVKPTDRVGVIGTGSSGLQVIGALATMVKEGKLTVFMRTPTYILPSGPMELDPERKKQFMDPRFYYRHVHLAFLASERDFTAFFRGSKHQANLQATAKAFMEANIKDKKLLEKLMPSYPVGCRRLTLTKPFLDAVQMPHVEVERGDIVRIDPKGLVTRAADGTETHHDLDLLVSATGFDVTYTNPRMKVTGRGGKDLWARFSPRPLAYRSVTVDGFPNFVFSMGPYPPLAHNSIFCHTQQQINYALQMVVRWQCDPTILSFEVKKDKVDEFDRKAQEFLKGSIWIEPCGGWYNQRGGGGYLVQWPGSGMHHNKSIYAPDYSDYIVEKVEGKL
ncbi:hypothetical protein DFJ74DRAFT_633537 [Hyaloraphidium curvatum]|nr:hypothetical protein DFJ74DRAFT_633537 [Hyaloraphidium curvatum]